MSTKDEEYYDDLMMDDIKMHNLRQEHEMEMAKKRKRESWVVILVGAVFGMILGVGWGIEDGLSVLSVAGQGVLMAVSFGVASAVALFILGPE